MRVVGNLPYNVSSPILFTLLARRRATARAVRDATLMLQKEVADRLVGHAGHGEYGVLAILVALQADVERVLTLPPGAFRPPPKVTSAVVRLRFRPPRRGRRRPGRRSSGWSAGVFPQRRKTLPNALKPVADSLRPIDAGELIDAAGVDGRKRPEDADAGRARAALAELCYSFPREVVEPCRSFQALPAA